MQGPTPNPRRTCLAAYCSPHIHKKADGTRYEGKAPLLVGGEPASEVAQRWR
jgi:hypothetical protein